MFSGTIQLYRSAYSGLSREVWLLAVVSLINRAGAMVFPFLTIYLTQTLGFSLKEAGVVMGFFGLGAILGAYLGGWLTDRIGDHKVQFWSLIATSLSMLVILNVRSFEGMILAGFLLSTSADAFRPANKVAVANYSKRENITRSFALLRLAVNLGFAVGPTAGGILAAWKGYDILFYADALTCLIAALIFKMTLKDERHQSSEQKQINKENDLAGVRPFSPLKDFFYLAFLVVIGLLAFAFFQLFYTMPVFLKQELRLDEHQIGLFMGLNGFIIVLFEMPIVYLLERNISNFKSMSLGALWIGLGFLCFIWPTNWLGFAVIGIIVLTIGEICYMPFASAFVAHRANDRSMGKYMALYTMSWSIASVVAPTLGFQLVAYCGFNMLWLVLFILGLLGAISFFWMGKAGKHLQKIKL